MKVTIEIYGQTRWLMRKGKLTKTRDFRWRMKANNGQIIAASTEGYTRRKACFDNLVLVTGIGVWPTMRSSDRFVIHRSKLLAWQWAVRP